MACLVAAFLIACASSTTTRRQAILRSVGRVPGRERVRGDHQVAAGDGVGEGLAPGALGAVVDVHPQLRGEPGGLPLPVADQRHRADQQARAAALARIAWRPGSSASSCTVLPRPMSSARTPPSPARLQEVQPGQAARLVRPQRAAEGRRHGDRRPAAARRRPDSRSPSQPSAVDALDRQRRRRRVSRPSPSRSSSPDAALAGAADQLQPAASRRASSSTHCPRSRTSGAFSSASSASSSAVSTSSPTARS